MGNTTVKEDNSHLATYYQGEADKAMLESKQAHEKAMKLLENENKDKQRKTLESTIKNVDAKIKDTEKKLKDARNEKISSERLKTKYSEQKKNFITKINNFSGYKEVQLQNFITLNKIDVAFEKYQRDRNEIEDAITKTGVHSDDVGKFLILTHAMTGATMNTQAQANKLDVALNTFGTIINNECQDKITIDSYFSEQNLDAFIPILSNEGYKTLEHMICDDEKEFTKVILTKLDKGIDREEKKQKEDALNKQEECKEEQKKQRIRLTEIENELKGIEKNEEKKKKEEKEDAKQKLISEQSEINNRISAYQKIIETQGEILERLENKAKEREERKKEIESDGKTENDDDEKYLTTDKEGEELCIYLLEQWKLKQYWEKLEDEGWDDPDDWATLTAEDLENDIEIKKKGHRTKFIRNAQKWKDKADKKEKEDEEKKKDDETDKNQPKSKIFYYLNEIQQRQLKRICLKSQETWGDYSKEKAKLVKNDLLQLCPVLGTFFNRMNIGVKQTEEYLNYKGQKELSDKQLQAIKMANKNKKKMKAIELKRKQQDGQKSLVENSKCEIYSDSDNKWYKGKVKYEKKDDNGTLLYVEYKVNDELKTIDIQKYDKNIRLLKTETVKENIDDDEKDDEKDDDDKNQHELVVQSNALITASMVSINVTDTLINEFTISKTTERGLTVALGVEDCCKNIIRNKGEIRQSVFLAQEILKYKPANMNDERTKQLWKAVDTGIIRIFSSALDMVRVSAEYFGFFLRFTNSFKFFVSCYSDGKDTSLYISLERLKKDIREFNKFRENFSKTVIELNNTAMECIGNCVKQQIGHENWDKTRKSIQQSEKKYLNLKKIQDQEATRLDSEKDTLEKHKVNSAADEARESQTCEILKSRIKQGEEYLKAIQNQLIELRTALKHT